MEYGKVFYSVLIAQSSVLFRGPLAQLVEQLTLNQRVRSSNLRRPIGNARVAELADALDLGSSPLNRGWGFKSPLSHCL